MTNPSKNTRTVATVGVDEETAAHIRLMLRMAEPRLTEAWRVGSEAEADFMLVETGTLEGEAALVRFQNEGRAYGLLCDRDAAVAHGLVLWTPIKQEQLVALFNSVSAARDLGTPGAVAKFDENFYDTELEKQIPVGKKGLDEVWQSDAERLVRDTPADRRGFGPPELEGLDRLIKGDPTVEPPKLQEIRLDDSVTLVEKEETESVRAQQRGNEAASHSTALNNIGVSPLDLIPISSTEPVPASLLNKHANGGQSAGQPLAALLADGALNRPTRISFGTHPALVLDPKPRHYYSQGALEELAIYATELLPEANIDGIFGSELQQVRDASEESRSYDELLWLIALLGSNGTLDRKLDPGGSYRVTMPLSCAHRLRSHGAILGAMSSARPLHEISKISGAPMVDVFDVVNAYAAIDRVEVVPRQRLKGDDNSTMGRLSRLFGKK